MRDLWGLITEDSTPKEQAFEDLDLLWEQNLRHSFYLFRDDIHPKNKKLLHQQGVVGKVRWHDKGGHNYTGLFKGGFRDAILRFSESDLLTPESTGLAPSFGMKILETGRHSVNVLTRVNFEPVDTWNFWRNDFKHRVNEPFENTCKKATIERKFTFNEGTFASYTLGISDMAKYNQDGSEVAEPNWPFEIIFKPWWDLRWKHDNAMYMSPTWQEQVLEVKTRDKIFEVYAKDQPETPEEEWVRIAVISARTDF